MRFRGAGGKTFDVLAPGLYAWGLTVCWPVSQRFAPLGSRIFALAALVSLVAGAALVSSAPRLARALGIWIFLAACLGTWGWFASAFGPAQFDPVQGVLGSVGWALFAISWAGDVAAPAPPLTATPSAAPPRSALPRTAVLVLALIALSASVPVILAWWVPGLERALFAHTVALAAAIALVTFAVDLFEPRSRLEEVGFDASRKPERRIAGALPAFFALTALAVLGAAYTMLR